MQEQGRCAYCRQARAVNEDHVIPRSVVKRRLRKLKSIVSMKDGGRRIQDHIATYDGRIVPNYLLGVTGACNPCNVAKASRLLIPESWSEYLDELNDLGIGTFRVWRGDTESLRLVVR